MRVRRNRHRGSHRRVEVFCRPLGWRAVAGRVVYASVAAVLFGGGAVAIGFWGQGADPWVSVTCASLSCACVASALWVTHLFNAARNPVMFKIHNGELTVVKPFLFLRRRRRLKTAEVQAVTVASDRDVFDGRPPTGRLRIRRRFRLPVRVPGRRPLHELDRVAKELRTVLRV